jgi:type IV pilus assembly protein PilA
MKKWLRKRLKNEKGLTLVELLAVIVILGIIAAIAVPAIGNIIDNSRVKAIKADAQNVLAAANLYFIDNTDDDGKVTVSELKTANVLEDQGSLTDTTEVTFVDGGANTINGSGKSSKTEVVFNNATSEQITKSGNSKSVPADGTNEG